MRIAVLDGFAVDQGQLSWDAVQRLGELAVYARSFAGQVKQRAESCQAVLVNKVVLTRDILLQLPELQYVGVTATGFNVVDIETCRQRGIAVTNVPGYSTRAVTQLVFALLLEHLEKVTSYQNRVKPNGWASAPDYCFFAQPRLELAGKTMAILGYGAIGQQIGRIASVFGMEVLPTALPGGSSEGRVPLRDALALADVVSLHCPLTARTERLVDDAFLAGMKDGAILINTSRGGLIDEAALVRALASDRLGGALLDVLASEPPPADHPLLSSDAPWSERVLVTPHIAWGAVQARVRLIEHAAANLAAFQRGERQNRVD